MNKLRTIIVDDEPLARDLMRAILAKQENIELIAECKNGQEALQATLESEVDLMFLDIQMPGLNGFDVIRSMQADTVPLVVFVTAYDQYALRAFEVHAVDYLLKPIDSDSVGRAIERCLERLATTDKQNGAKPGIINAIDNIQQQKGSAVETAIAPVKDDQKIVVKDRGAITFIEQQDIDWVDAAGDYMCLHVEGVTHIMRSTMKDLVALLNPAVFKRIHRSTIVNMQRIKKIIPHTKGEYFLDIGQTDRIKVSRNYREVIKDFIEES